MAVMLFSRLFLGMIPKNGLKSTLHDKLNEDNALDSFKNLAEKYINWRSGAAAIGSEIEDSETEIEEDFTFGPLKKKMKKM